MLDYDNLKMPKKRLHILVEDYNTVSIAKIKELNKNLIQKTWLQICTETEGVTGYTFFDYHKFDKSETDHNLMIHNLRLFFNNKI